MASTNDFGDSSAMFRGWVETHTDSLYSWAFHKTGHKETAEDLVQETFLAAYTAMGGFEGRSNVRTWLFGILHHKIADHFRKKIPEYIPAPDTEGQHVFQAFFEHGGSGEWIASQRPRHWPEEPNLVDDKMFNKILQLCLGKLPAAWNAAVQLKYLEEKKGDQICQELNISPTNFWQILHRAKLSLRKCLEINWFKQL